MQKCEKYGNKKYKVKISEYQNQLSKCEYSNYKCSTCLEIFEHDKKKCYEHALICGYSNILCNYCKRSIKKYLKEEHENKCKAEKVPCEYCKNSFAREIINHHSKIECEMRIVECENCKEKYIFKNGHNEKKCILNLREKLDKYKSFLQIHNLIAQFDEEQIYSERFQRAKTEPNYFKSMYERFEGSSIIREKDEVLLNQLFEKNKNIEFNLLYKMSSDDENDFHLRCDNIGATISFCQIQILDGCQRFGIYTPANWDCSESTKKDDNLLFFSLTKHKIFSLKKNGGIYCSKNYGPSFVDSSLLRKPVFYIQGKKGEYFYSVEDPKGEFTGGNRSFKVVYKVSLG